MLSIFGKWFGTKKLQESSIEEDLRKLQQFLEKKVPISSFPNSLLAFYQSFNNSNAQEKAELLPKFYLKFEQHYAELVVRDNNARFALRREVRQKFPAIAEADRLDFIFNPQFPIDLKLCQVFLSEVLTEVINVLGQAKEKYFETARDWTHQISNELTPFPHFEEDHQPADDPIAYLAEVSAAINETLVTRMGQAFAQRIYNKCYNRLAANYRYLSEFPGIISLIPARYLDTDKIGLLSNHQLSNTLLEQVSDLEILNAQLTQRNKELRNAQITIEEEKVKSQDAFLQLKEVMNAVGDGIITASSDSKIMMVNKKVEEIWGYTAEELIGQNLTILMPESFRQRHLMGMDRYLHSRESSVLGKEVRMYGLRKDGSEFPLEISISDLEYRGRHLFTAAVRDISTREKFEQDLQNSKDQLQIRTRELERIRRELEKTVFELRASNIELEQYAYMVSHDLQAPLQSIDGYIDLLKARDPKKEQLEFLSHIDEGISRMQDMIKNLLEYSRIGRVESAPRQIDFEVVVRPVLYNLRKQIEESQAKIKLHYEGPIYGDKTQLQQVFQNLISNALKFQHPDQPPEVILHGHEEPDHYRFEIKDNGIGIAEENRERVFAVFERLHSSESYYGSGIGLAICKKIVEIHGGKIWIESNDLDGTSFFFTLDKGI